MYDFWVDPPLDCERELVDEDGVAFLIVAAFLIAVGKGEFVGRKVLPIRSVVF
jgi:hypothetical protein